MTTAAEIAQALGGKPNGSGWIARCPAHNDRTPSLSIGEGRDGQALWKCHAGCSQEAVRDALEVHGLFESKSSKEDADTQPDLDHPKFSKPHKIYKYRDADDRVVGAICRWDLPEGKQVRPAQKVTGGWRWRAFPAPRPLYRLLSLLAQPDAPVLVVEGEKTARAARKLAGTEDAPVIDGQRFDGVVTTWAGGTNALRKTDFSPLAGRDVILWPDADQPGIDAMFRLSRLLGDARSVRLINIPDELSDGWDLADSLPDGLASPLNVEGIDPAEVLPSQPPTIELRPGERPRIVREAATALIEAGAPIFRRGGLLVRTAFGSEIAESEVRRPADATVLMRVSAPWLTLRLGEAAAWTRYDKREQAYVPKDPPPDVAGTIIAASDELPFASLRAIVRHPILTPDGTLTLTPGFDSSTGLLLDFAPGSFPDLPKDLSRKAAAQAFDRLRHLVRYFPFSGEEDAAVAISAILSALARPVLPTVPAHAFDAPVAASGKSLLTHTVSLLSSGTTASMASPGKTEEEAEKRLEGALIAGDPVIVLDNAERPLGGERLCQCLTEPSVRVRPLGASTLVTIPNTAFIMMTGNNLRFRGDVTRRVLVSRIDPESERPELRHFDQDILKTARDRRGQYGRYALTILAAYARARRPDVGTSPLGGFEAWSRMVRDALIWAGAADPVKTMERMRFNDPELAELRELITAWETDLGERPISSRYIVKKAEQDPETSLSRSLPVQATDRGKPNAKRLGYYLARIAGRIVDRKRIVRAESSRGVARWRLETL